MNVFGVGPGELILIMIILLVVVGPERLPGLARQGGQMLVRVRNWVQKSPDAAMIMRARQEIEMELSSLRASLLEVQNVRDEVMEAAKQVNQTFTEDIGGAFKELTDTINKDGIQAMKQSANDALKAANSAVQSAESAADAADAAAISANNGQSVARARNRQTSFGPQQTDLAQDDLLEQLLDSAPTDELIQDPAATADFSALSTQIDALLREMQALQTELRQRGVLDADWQPPSVIEHAAAEPVTTALLLDDAPLADDAALMGALAETNAADLPLTELRDDAALPDAGTPLSGDASLMEVHTEADAAGFSFDEGSSTGDMTLPDVDVPLAAEEPHFATSTDSLDEEPHFATSTESISEEQLP